MKLIADIGGTHMRLVLAHSPEAIEEPIILDTPQDFKTAVSTFAENARSLARGRQITSATIGTAGLLSPDRAQLLRAPHLPGWVGKPLVDEFSQALGAPAQFENDVALGALGEAHFGAGKGANIIAYIAVGTGVGGARVVDGRLDRAAYGFEVGHQLLGHGEGAPEWEQLVSGSGLEKKYRIPSSQMVDMIIRNEVAKDFAYGLYNALLHWAPDRVVLGGMLFTSGFIPLEVVTATLASINTALLTLPPIRLGDLADRPGLYGGLLELR